MVEWTSRQTINLITSYSQHLESNVNVLFIIRQKHQLIFGVGENWTLYILYNN